MTVGTDSTREHSGLPGARELLRRCCTGQCAGDGHACDRTPSPDFPEVDHPGRLDPSGPLSPDVQRAIARATSEPLLGGNTVRLLADGTEYYAEMLNLVAAARRDLQFENFIFRSDAVGRVFADQLARRAADGVRTRVLYDPFGSIMSRRGPIGRRFRGTGVEARAYNPLRLHLDFLRDGRDHRKLVVRDRREAVVGGMCLADAWLGNCVDRCTWKDAAVLVRGPAAERCGRAFDDLWSGTARRGGNGRGPGASERTNAEAPSEMSSVDGEVPVRVIPGSPGDGRLADVLEAVFAAAREEILVTSPYLVPPASILGALTGAARRGVRVHVLVPGRNNHPVAGLASEQLQGELLRAGVRVARWSGPMLHAKCVVVDRRWSLVGSSNLDSLSLRHNAELDVAVHGPAFGRQMADLFERDLARSERYRRDMWEAAPATRRAARLLSAALRPWL